MLTLLVYLSNVRNGGHTVFPCIGPDGGPPADQVSSTDRHRCGRCARVCACASCVCVCVCIVCIVCIVCVCVCVVCLFVCRVCASCVCVDLCACAPCVCVVCVCWCVGVGGCACLKAVCYRRLTNIPWSICHGKGSLRYFCRSLRPRQAHTCCRWAGRLEHYRCDCCRPFGHNYGHRLSPMNRCTL